MHDIIYQCLLKLPTADYCSSVSKGMHAQTFNENNTSLPSCFLCAAPIESNDKIYMLLPVKLPKWKNEW